MSPRKQRRRGAEPPSRDAYSATAGLHFDDVELEQRLVWIWTMARSGSTWFLKMLSHPLKLVDSSGDPDDYLGFVAPPAWQGEVDVIPVDTTFVANHLLPTVGRSHYADDGSPITFASALGLTRRGNYFFSPKYDDAWLPELRRMMLVRFHRLIERTADRYPVRSPLILLKEVAGAQAAPLIMSMFPRSRMIFLVRDGRDVVDSQTAANRPGGWLPVSGWSTDEERSEFVRDRAKAWVGDVGSIQRAFDGHPEDRRRFVRYEDLLKDAGGVIEPLMEWFDLRRSENWLERSVEVNSFSSIAPEQKGEDRFFRSATPGAWRRNLTAEDARVMEGILAPKLESLGYAVDAEVKSAPEPASAADDGDDDPDPVSGASGEPEGGEDATGPVDVLSATLMRRGAGRDYTGLGEMITRRGGPASRRARQVALTFDDGPVLQSYDVVETLERYGARGTFFLVGRKIAGHEALIDRLLAGGHQIGNHSYAHAPFPEPEDVAANSKVLEHLMGSEPELYRPPFGAVDRPAAQAAIDRGLRVVLWNVDSDDGTPPWKGIPAEEIIDNVTGSIVPGSIVLMHDGLSWSRAAEALPTLIERLQGEGYELVTVRELTRDDEAPAGGTASPLRRLRGRAKSKLSSAEQPPRPADSQAEPLPSAPDFAEIAAWIGDGIEPPTGEEPWQELVARACRAIAEESVAGSSLLPAYAAALENDSLRAVLMGFALRVAESEPEPSRQLPEPALAELRAASEPRAVSELVRRLSRPTRVDRLVKARVAEQEGEPPGVDPDRFGAKDEFLAIFEPGGEAWDRIQSWARVELRRAAAARMEALLSEAGTRPSIDIDELMDRVDIDYFLRSGYVLAACEEALSPALR